MRLPLPLLLIGCLIASFTCGPVHAAGEAGKKLLVVTVTKGFRHSSIPTAERVLARLAEESGLFTVDFVRNDEEMAVKMTPAALRAYDGIVFANTTGQLPIPDKRALLSEIRGGKAFLGMHSASDTLAMVKSSTPLLGIVRMCGRTPIIRSTFWAESYGRSAWSRARQLHCRMRNSGFERWPACPRNTV
jgi:hypothetical protein